MEEMPAAEEVLEFDAEQLFWKRMEGVKVKFDTLKREEYLLFEGERFQTGNGKKERIQFEK